ncbi:hypothetical protein LINPERHAP1_LOCUS5144 [Linum perenne]
MFLIKRKSCKLFNRTGCILIKNGSTCRGEARGSKWVPRTPLN